MVDFIYDDAHSFKNGIAMVKKRSKWGLIDSTGQVIVPLKYNDINDFY